MKEKERKKHLLGWRQQAGPGGANVFAVLRSWGCWWPSVVAWQPGVVGTLSPSLAAECGELVVVIVVAGGCGWWACRHHRWVGAGGRHQC